MALRRFGTAGRVWGLGCPTSGLEILPPVGRQASGNLIQGKKSTGVWIQYLSSNKNTSADLLVQEF